jgi:hypothetical protein
MDKILCTLQCPSHFVTVRCQLLRGTTWSFQIMPNRRQTTVQVSFFLLSNCTRALHSLLPPTAAVRCVCFTAFTCHPLCQVRETTEIRFNWTKKLERDETIVGASSPLVVEVSECDESSGARFFLRGTSISRIEPVYISQMM